MKTTFLSLIILVSASQAFASNPFETVQEANLRERSRIMREKEAAEYVRANLCWDAGIKTLPKQDQYPGHPDSIKLRDDCYATFITKNEWGPTYVDVNAYENKANALLADRILEIPEVQKAMGKYMKLQPVIRAVSGNQIIGYFEKTKVRKVDMCYQDKVPTHLQFAMDFNREKAIVGAPTVAYTHFEDSCPE